MERYLLWAVDSDGVFRLIGRFQDMELAKMFARMLHVRDDYRDYDFCVEEF